MKPSLEKATVPRWIIKTAWCLAIVPPLYVLSIGPVAWACNDAEHPAYLPEPVMSIYAPLGLLCGNHYVESAFEYYVIDVWHGFPYGYTTP